MERLRTILQGGSEEAHLIVFKGNFTISLRFDEKDYFYMNHLSFFYFGTFPSVFKEFLYILILSNGHDFFLYWSPLKKVHFLVYSFAVF